MTPGKKPAQRAEPAPKPGIEVDDHLYVHHGGQPCTGRVVCHGRHGVTVDVGGKNAKVTWDKVLGHKRRVALQGDVVDQGEDGMIVQDKGGRRRFVAVPNEATEDPMVAKSFGQRPVMLFMKAGGPPGPGLARKQITDKNGVQTTRWVSTAAKSPPAQRGQHVGFANGEHRSHGEVIASGKHGVTVRDAAGGHHRVHHEKVTHHWGGEGKPPSSPHEDPAGKTNDPKYLFDEAELAKLPAKVNQPHATWEDLVKHGAEGLAQFRESLGKVAQVMGLQSGKKPDELTPEDWESDKGYLFLAPLKGAARAKEKVEADYDGDWSQLRDLVRATISVPSMHGVSEALTHLKDAGIELAQRPKDRFSKPTDEGYRDLMTIVKLPNGMLAELQIHVKAMTLAKEKGHEHYNVSRSLAAKYGEDRPSEKWKPEDKAKFDEAVAAQREIYDTVWTKASGDKDAQPSENGDKSLIKSEQPARILLWKT